MNYGACTAIVKHSLVKVEENKRKAVFFNQGGSKFAVTRVDDCLVTAGERVDYLVSKEGVASALVELKGRDVEHACDQIESSLKNKSVTDLLEERVGFVIVCSRYPKTDTKVQRAKQRIAKKFGAILQVACNEGHFDIEAIAGKKLVMAV